MKLFILIVFFYLGVPFCSGLTDEEIRRTQSLLKDEPIGERIAFWAEKFVGTPYDPDPLGEYVSKRTIVADERIDCMYLTFRAVELAFTSTPEAAVEKALSMRFHSRGVLKGDKVVNYDDRFQYGEDMIDSGKWGEEITFKIGRTMGIQGSRGREFVDILSDDHLLKAAKDLKSGDIIFFIKRPEKRQVEEIVGHLGIIKIEKDPGNPEKSLTFLIHASGAKNSGGMVKKVLLKDYVSKMPFVGVRITRFHERIPPALPSPKEGD